MIGKMPNCAYCSAVADGVDAFYDNEGKIRIKWLCKKCLEGEGNEGKLVGKNCEDNL